MRTQVNVAAEGNRHHVSPRACGKQWIRRTVN